MDEPTEMPVTLKLSDIEHQAEPDCGKCNVGDAMAIDTMDVDEESHADGDRSVADNLVPSDIEERPQTLESGDSSESFAGESSSSSSASGFEEAGPMPEQPTKRKAGAKKKSNRKIVSQSVTAAVQHVKVAKEDLVDLTIFDGGSELSDIGDDSGNPTPTNRAGGEVGVQDETIEPGE
jgi:hypothetical protein